MYSSPFPRQIPHVIRAELHANGWVGAGYSNDPPDPSTEEEYQWSSGLIMRGSGRSAQLISRM